MEYLKINNTDYSKYVSALKINKVANFSSQTNAAGNTVIDFINFKRSVEVSFISLDADIMQQLQTEFNTISVLISFRNPATNEVEEINCFTAGIEADYYTIQENKVMYKPFTLSFTEL